MELAENSYRISAKTAKPLHLYVLAGEERTLLLDTATAQTPETVIPPCLAGKGIDIEGRSRTSPTAASWAASRRRWT